MNISRRWLEAFLRRPLDARDTANRLAMLGAAVDAIEPLHAGLSGVVVGLVRDVRPHPNADRLRLCTVDSGSGAPVPVVCGASNVTAGRKYPFAPVGATLPGNLIIAKRKIRGETSEGMLCSARELGLGADADGILELETAAAPGTPLLDALPLDDDRLVIDVTPNRPDLLCHKGVARELAGSLGIPFRLPELPGVGDGTAPSPRRVEEAAAEVAGVRMAIEDRDGCRRLLGAVVRGVKIGPSAAWLRYRLEAVGARSINNVVDATNYVMLELNQPMHAYDLAKLKGPSVWVRRGRPGEVLVTLDHVRRELTDEMTVIADDGGAIGVGGVMGGAYAEVTEATTDVFLECAWFDPRRVRRTRQKLGLSTDASYRFERGMDLWGGPDAIRRCLTIILATAGGRLAGEPLDLWPHPANPPRVFLRPERVTRLLGIELPASVIESCLSAIGAVVLPKPADGRIAVEVPGWRPDLVAEIDLIEEIARIHGYDKFPMELRPFRLGRLQDAPDELVARRVRQGLAARGLLEAQTVPFGPRDGDESLELTNPLSAEERYLRHRLLPGLLKRVEGNWSSRVRAVRLFELGTVFADGGPGRLPREQRHVAAVLTGERTPPHWTDGGHTPDVDLWDLKGLFQDAVALANPEAMVQVEEQGWVARTPDGRTVGRAGRLEADRPPWAAPVFGFELVVDPSPRGTVRFRSLPTTPSSEKDLSLLLPPGLPAAEVERAIRTAAGPLLEETAVIEEYRGDPLPAGHRSVLFRLTFRAPDRTLREEEVEPVVDRIAAALERELRVKRRGVGG